MIRIKELRQKHNLSLRDLADILNLSYSSLGKYERGEQQPSVETLIKIADYFHISVDYLIGHSTNSTPSSQKVYDEIGLSDASIEFLKSLKRHADQLEGSVFADMIPLKCIDFCLQQGEDSFRLFDSINSYFITQIPDDKTIYILPDGTITLKPSLKNTIMQAIPSSYLPDTILQEISERLKKMKTIYIQNTEPPTK